MNKKKHPNPYLRALEPFSPEELDLISQVKRFFECVQAEPGFRDELGARRVLPERRERLRQIGVTFDLDEIAVLWEEPEAVGPFMASLQSLCQDELPEEPPDAFESSRPLHLWARCAVRRAQMGRELRGRPVRVPKSPNLDAWRQRRIAATRSELGFFGHHIDHPVFAFELGDGCSVGCWFCAFATRKLTENLDYPAHRDFFRSVIQSCVELFGKGPASAALLYYGTEPHDNPHYFDFIKDHAELTSRPSCTSTAVPADTKWLRELIAYYRQWALPWPRLSVLSPGMFRQIHDLYSPEELRDVQLLMQMKNQPRKKVTGGRILEEQAGLRDREEGHYLDDLVAQGSIACVSGFLTNLVNRTIQLTSPCYTSERWPYGYRVFDEATFADADDFPRVIEQLIERNMPSAPASDQPARFRDDLAYRPTDEGFDLVSPNQVHHFRGQRVYGVLGRLMAANGLTCEGLYNAMLGEHGINPMVVVAVVKKLFDEGFLDEVRGSRESPSR